MREIAEASRYLIPALWAVWIVVWTAAAWNVKRTRWKEPQRAAAYNRLPVLLGIAILISPRLVPAALDRRIVPLGPQPAFWGLVLVVAGILFSFWARWQLGRNWSSQVTVKEGHSLVTAGPYGWVRHPIYTGMLLALLGTALAMGSARGFIGTALILAGFIVKLLAEEARMRETFPGAYDDYCRRTARLIPGVF
jgi:protein-S-isoprenylcysteine O-methyltransferase Ste14